MSHRPVGPNPAPLHDPGLPVSIWKLLLISFKPHPQIKERLYTKTIPRLPTLPHCPSSTDFGRWLGFLSDSGSSSVNSLSLFVQAYFVYLFLCLCSKPLNHCNIGGKKTNRGRFTIDSLSLPSHFSSTLFLSLPKYLQSLFVQPSLFYSFQQTRGSFILLFLFSNLIFIVIEGYICCMGWVGWLFFL